MPGSGDTKTRKKEASFLKEFIVDWGDLLSEQKIKKPKGSSVLLHLGGTGGSEKPSNLTTVE